MNANKRTVNVCLFHESGTRYKSNSVCNTLYATRNRDGSLEFSYSRAERDASIYGGGTLSPVLNKFSEKSPDFKGKLVDAKEEFLIPASYEVVAWWKTTQRGQNAGQQYLSVCMTEVSPAAFEPVEALTLEEFYDQLERHDWFSGFSDAYSVESAGKRDRSRLDRIAKQQGRDHEALIAAFQKYHFSGESWNTPKWGKPARPVGGVLVLPPMPRNVGG